MDAQEIFDKVATHLLKQGRRSLTETGSCAYRGVNGAMCAVGCLIPNHHYSPEMEGGTAEDLLIYHGEFLPELNPHVELLSDLQALHDEYEVELWPIALASVAKSHRLSADVLEAA